MDLDFHPKAVDLDIHPKAMDLDMTKQKPWISTPARAPRCPIRKEAQGVRSLGHPVMSRLVVPERSRDASGDSTVLRQRVDDGDCLPSARLVGMPFAELTPPSDVSAQTAPAAAGAATDASNGALAGTVPRHEARFNDLFSGDPDAFENLGWQPDENWEAFREHVDLDVALDRVRRRLKPVAIIHLDEAWHEAWSIENLCSYIRQDFNHQMNWTIGFECRSGSGHSPAPQRVVATAQLDHSLWELMLQRDRQERELIAKWLEDDRSVHELKTRCVRTYMVHLAGNVACVNILEYALLFGCPLDAAGKCEELDWPYFVSSSESGSTADDSSSAESGDEWGSSSEP